MKFSHALLSLALATLAYSSSSYAIDQLTLFNGEKIQGKVLNEEANLYVDFEYSNGTKKRFAKSEVVDVQRDIPSDDDNALAGVDSRMYIGGLIGASFHTPTGSTISNTQVNYGARLGVNAARLGDLGKLAVGLHFDRYQYNIGTSTSSYSFMSILGQLLIRKISNTGFYLGPEAGLGIVTLTTGSLSYTNSAFTMGGLVGYDYFASPTFSFGPEVHYENFAAVTGSTGITPGASAWKFLMSLTVHFL